MLNRNDSYLCYVDGSCWTKNRIGSYAWIAVDSDFNEYLDGGVEHDTTISQMELFAPTKALEFLRELAGPSIILICSDSEYVVKGISDPTRKRNKNISWWDRLDKAVGAHELVAFDHVKGHSGEHYNEMVDAHCDKLRRAAQ